MFSRDYSGKVTEIVEKNKDYSCSKLAITEVASRYMVTESIVKKDMLNKKSPYLTEIAGYINGKPMHRISVLQNFRKIVNKIIRKIEKKHGAELSIKEKYQVMEYIELELIKTS